MEENKKRKIIVAIIGILALLVVVAGATYAFFSATDTEEVKQITTAKEELDLKIEGSTHVSNIKPIIWREDIDEDLSEDSVINDNQDIVQIPITVTNNSSIDLRYDLTVNLSNLKFKNESLTGGDTSDIKYRLYEEHSFIKNKYLIDYIGDFENPDYNQKIFHPVVSISSGESQRYKLIIYIQDTEVAQNKLQGLEFDVEIKANTVTTNSREGMTLVDAIMEDNDIKKRNPDFKSYNIYEHGNLKNDAATNYDMGLYKMQNEDIYYFRGPYHNNYVYFGVQDENGRSPGYPLKWRIMRINKDKSVTLVYNYAYDNPYIKSKYSSNNTTTYNDSDVKITLDKWYEDNIKANGLDDMVIATDFCNDTNYDNVLNRLNKENPTPTLECNQENKVSSKIGLITADEVVFAGGLYNKTVDLRLTNGPYIDGTYTMTGTSEGKVGHYHLGRLDELNVSTERNILPVITLKPGVKLISQKDYNIDDEIIDYKALNIGDNRSPYLIG